MGDVVAYATRVGRYGDLPERHQRLTAVLRVIHVFADHRQAAKWYKGKGLPLPTNCMVRSNKPKPLDQSQRLVETYSCASDAETHEGWDAAYRERADLHSTFVVCRKLWTDLSYSAPALHAEGFH